MRDVFKGIGVPAADAAVCAEVLITSDKFGIDSHGVSRLKPIYYDRIKQGIQLPRAKFEVVKETPTTAVIDGHNGMGHVIAVKAMNLAIKKAKRYGLGMTAVRNSTHYGIAGYHALLAAKAGATYISPFIGRLDDLGIDGMDLIRSIVTIYENDSTLKTQVLAASIRDPLHVVQSAEAGSHVATIPFKVLKQMGVHPLTDKGNAQFLADWQTAPDTDIIGQTTRWLAGRK